MKSNFKNDVSVQGYIFDHSLEKRTSQKGVDYIGGIVNVATDDQALNVVPVHFIYVTETYAKSGKQNANFGILERIIDENNVYSVNGTEAQKVRISGNIGVNDFVTRDGEMASPKRVVGSFIHLMSANEVIADEASKFEADMLISNAVDKEVEDGEDYLQLSGYVFDFRGGLVPVDFTVRGKAGISYFQGQDISNSNPLCTKVWGNIVSTTISKEETVESAFGAPQVNVTSRTLRSWDVVGASAEAYEWDDESFITKAELKDALAAREEQLAEVRKRNEEYRNSKSGKSGFPSEEKAKKQSASTDDGDFPF